MVNSSAMRRPRRYRDKSTFGVRTCAIRYASSVIRKGSYLILAPTCSQNLPNGKSVSHTLQVLQNAHMIRLFARQEQRTTSIKRFARAPDRVRRHAVLAAPQRLQDTLIVARVVGAERQWRDQRNQEKPIDKVAHGFWVKRRWVTRQSFIYTKLHVRGPALKRHEVKCACEQGMSTGEQVRGLRLMVKVKPTLFGFEH